MTNLGVTKRVWEAYTGKPANEATMRGLTPEMVKPLYKANYWDKVRGDDLPSGVDYCLFDIAVNSGPSRAVILLQRALGVKDDGSLGPVTLAKAAAADPKDLVKKICAARLAFMKSLSTWATFGKGWERRVSEVQATASTMV